MNRLKIPQRSSGCLGLRVALLASLTSGLAVAQDPPEPAPAKPAPAAPAPAKPAPAAPAPAKPAPAAPAAEMEPAAEAAPAPAAEPAPAEAPMAEPAPEPPATAMAAPEPAMAEAEPEPMPMPEPMDEEPMMEEESKLASVSVGAWLRAGVKLQNPTNTERLDDIAFDGAYGELHLSGQVHEQVNWTFNLNANGNAGTAGIMDAIVQLDLTDPFHLWVGQMLVPSDRNNFSGPFFMSPWNYPGLTGPRQGKTGRNVGATAWGDFGGGKFKYYVGAFDFEGGDASRPLYTGRLNLAIIGEEPGFYHSSTYYGDKDILAIAVGGQYQGQTPNLADNYRMFNADLLAEFSPGGGSAGTITVEGAYYRGQEALATDGVMALGSYLLPGEIGPGRVQLGVRYQGRFEENAANSPVTSIVDAWLAYLIKSYNLRFTATYARTDDTGPNANAIQLGVQTIQ